MTARAELRATRARLEAREQTTDRETDQPATAEETA